MMAFLLPALALSWPKLQTQQQVEAAVSITPNDLANLIIDNYNKQSVSNIYAKFAPSLKKNITLAQFTAGMASLFNSSGKIADSYWLNTSLTSLGVMLAVFEKKLDVAEVLVSVDSAGLLTSLYFKMSLQSTYELLAKKGSDYALVVDSTFGQVVVNPDVKLTICSVFKVTVLLTLAQEIANRNLDKLKCYSLQDINRYFLPHVDGTHTEWLKTLDGSLCATLPDIAYGVLAYSSNANTEFLIDLLTPAKVDVMVFKTLGAQTHDPTIYLASSMLAMNNTKGLPRDQWLAALRALTPAQARAQAQIIHNQLKADPDGQLRQQDSFYLDPQVIDIHVDLLQASTAYEYVRIAKLINSRTFFPNLVQLQIEAIFNRITFLSEFGRQNYKLAGTKGGSANYPGMTNAALAVMNFATRVSGQKSQASLIYNGLTSEEFSSRLQDLDRFIIGLQFSNYFVKELGARLKSDSQYS